MGNYTDENGTIKKIACDYTARNLELNPIEKFSRLGEILGKDKMASRYEISNMSFYLINLGESYSVIEYDLKYNYVKNLYDFNVNRSEVFSGKFSVNNYKGANSNNNQNICFMFADIIQIYLIKNMQYTPTKTILFLLFHTFKLRNKIFLCNF